MLIVVCLVIEDRIYIKIISKKAVFCMVPMTTHWETGIFFNIPCAHLCFCIANHSTFDVCSQLENCPIGPHGGPIGAIGDSFWCQVCRLPHIIRSNLIAKSIAM